MLFISNTDRAAGVAAFEELSRYMQTKLPAEDIFQIKEEHRRGEAEKAWDEAKPEERDIMLAIWQSSCAPGSYYECHLTFDPEQIALEKLEKDLIREIGEKYHFKYSTIEGDEQMGAGLKCYLTRSLTDGATLSDDMNALTLALTQAGIPILRRKIEHIIFDERRDRLAGTGKAA